MVDLISASFWHVLTGGAVTCRKPSPQLSIGLLLSRGLPVFGQRVTWKTIPRPGRWKRLDSAARVFYPGFRCIPTSPQIPVIATPMRSRAVSKGEGVICLVIRCWKDGRAPQKQIGLAHRLEARVPLRRKRFNFAQSPAG